MAEPTVTLRQVFSIPSDDAKDRSPGQWKTFQETLAQELKSIKCPVPMSELIPKICELFDIGVPSLLVSWWKAAEDLQTIIEESKEEPEAIRYLELAEHTIDSEHRPYLEVRIKKASLKKIEFCIRLRFRLKGFVLKINEGRIKEMKTGLCEVEGTVECEKATILKKSRAPIHLPGTVPLEVSPVVTSSRSEAV
ncbi:MAG TPA: hypothetical protein VNG71_18645 [Pyrinomonadaceae bacterium]|nr:hypothetical protein [Pyrinomonadaceae bacterium]